MIRFLNEIVPVLILVSVAYFSFNIVRHEYRALSPITKEVIKWLAMVVTLVLAIVMFIELRMFPLGPRN